MFRLLSAVCMPVAWFTSGVALEIVEGPADSSHAVAASSAGLFRFLEGECCGIVAQVVASAVKPAGAGVLASSSLLCS